MKAAPGVLLDMLDDIAQTPMAPIRLAGPTRHEQPIVSMRPAGLIGFAEQIVDGGNGNPQRNRGGGCCSRERSGSDLSFSVLE